MAALAVLLLLLADLHSLRQRIETTAQRPAAQRELLALAKQGDKDAQYLASRMSRLGLLPLTQKQADLWLREAVARENPDACLEEANSLLDLRKDADAMLRCAVKGKLPEAQYLLGRSLLNKTAAEDEAQRFEGLAWLAIAAREGHAGAIRRWELVAAELIPEDLELVEQTIKRLEVVP